MKMLLKNLMLLGIVAMLLVTCKKEDDKDVKEPVVVLGPNTVWFDEPTSETIKNVDSVGIVMEGNTLQLSNLKLGDIIVSGIAPNAPDGFLRKITAIQKEGDKYTFTTEEVPLTEAFEELDIDFTQSFTIEDTLGLTSGKIGSFGFNIPFPNLILYDADKNTNTKFDQVVLGGNFNFTPEIRVRIKISKFKLEDAYIGGNFNSVLNHTLNVSGPLLGISASKVVFDKPLGKIWIPKTPIVVIPSVNLEVGINGGLSVQVEFANSMTFSGANYLEYNQIVGWKTIYNRSLSNNSDFSGVFGNIDANLYVKPALNFKFYGSNWAKASAFVSAYSNLNAQITPPKPCELKAGIKGGAEANLTFFSWDFVSASYPEIFDFSKIVYTCANSTEEGVISALNCNSPTNNGTLTQGTAASGVSSSIPYTGGNGGTHGGQTVSSTGVTGLTATLTAGTFANGNGSLTYTITGTPVGNGTASFALNIGGKTCTFTRTVNTATGTITTLNCNSPTNNGTLTQGTAASGVSSSIPYTGGNGGTHNGQTVSSTEVTGLTATLTAGTFANGNGSLTYTITGTPIGNGTATFALNIGGKTCSLTRTVNINTPTTNPYLNPNLTYGSVTDIDGNKYATIQIGNQTWMAENLKVTRYNDGAEIPHVREENWANISGGARSFYELNIANNNIYGTLYNGNAVLTGKLCPTGWHIPSDDEWWELVDYLGGYLVAGGKMKSTSNVWEDPNTGASNSSGFSALPGGYRDFLNFYNLGYYGNWWTSTEDNFGLLMRYLAYNKLDIENAGRVISYRARGNSCRCIRD